MSLVSKAAVHVLRQVARSGSGAGLAGAAPLRTLPDHFRPQHYDGLLLGALGKFYLHASAADQIPGFAPDNGKRAGEKVFFVNGATTSPREAREACQVVANATGYEILGVYDATRGVTNDLGELAGCMLDIQHSLPESTVARLVLQRLKTGTPIHLMGHSQGAVTISAALRTVKAQLRARGLTEQEIERQLSVVKVETLGSPIWDFPKGPHYVHYVNRADRMTWAGMGLRRSIPHGVLRAYNTWRFRSSEHELPNMLKHWVPFDEASGS